MLDLIIRNGDIIDGTGQPAFDGDIGIRDGKITVIGYIPDAEAKETIDARGMVVSPGFIDVHTHTDFTLMADPRAEAHVRQGVTTVVVGQCGTSQAPIEEPEAANPFHDPSIEVNWKSFDEYLNRLHKLQLGVNVVPCVGHGTVRRVAMKMEPRPANAEEVSHMARLTEEAFEQGAFAITTGLEYPPGKDSSVDELAALFRVAARYGGIHASHVRNRDIYYDMAFSEVISLSRATGIRLQISHINPKYGRPDDAMANTLEMIRWARKEGIDVQMDMMPCTQNHTALAAILLPSWVWKLDMQEMVELLNSDHGRKKLKAGHRSMWQLVTDGKWDRIYLFSSRENTQYIGVSMAEIGKDRGKDPHDVAFDLLVEEGANAKHMFCVGDSFSDDDNRLVLTDPCCSIGSDAIGLALDGVFADTFFTPLIYNYYPHFFETYIKEKRWLTLQEGVRRCTSLPATQIGLTNRGTLQPGAAADIVVFDPERFKDKSSIRNPNVYPKGLEYVIVNGQMEIRSGQRLATNEGQILRRT